MKQTSMKLMALGLSVFLAVGSLGGAVCARAGDGGAAAPVSGEAPAPVSSAGPAAFRDETVYVLAGADGTVEKVIVSDWLKNPQGLAQLRDAAGLEDVET